MTTNQTWDFPGLVVDEYERDLLRTLELALQNPAAGSAADVELTTLVEKTKRYDAERFPFRMHQLSGALCSCALHCVGSTACACWCHQEAR